MPATRNTAPAISSIGPRAVWRGPRAAAFFFIADSFEANPAGRGGGAREPGGRDAGIRRIGVAAAERPRETDVELERARLQVGVEPVLHELLRLRREHRQVVAEPRLVADDGEVVGVGRGLARPRLLVGDARQLTDRRQRIGDLAHRVDQRLVVRGDREIAVRLPLAQVGVEAAALEDRQMHGRSDARDRAARGQQVRQPDRIEADEGDEIHVRIEHRLGDGDVLARGFDAPARRHDLGPPRHEVERNGRGQRAVRHARGVPRDDRLASFRSRTDQRGDLVPRDRDGIVVLRELGANGRERGLGLLHLDPRVEPCREALRREAHDVLALRDRGARDLALREEPLQIEIGAGDAGGEQHTRRFGLRRRGLRARQRRLERRAVLVPEIELVGEVERQRGCRYSSCPRTAAGRCNAPSSAGR